LWRSRSSTGDRAGAFVVLIGSKLAEVNRHLGFERTWAVEYERQSA